MNTNPSTERNWARGLLGAVALCFFLLLALILGLRPWYGLMDDGGLLQLCGSFADKGPIIATQEYVNNDLGWGMFRPLYPSMVFVLYCSGGPTTLFLLNLIFVFVVLGALALALYEILPEPRWPRRIFLPSFCLGTLAVYRFHDLFTYPSLQEKLVLSAAALTIWVFSKWIRRTGQAGENAVPTHLLDILLIILLVLLGISTKAQFLMFFPFMGLALLINLRERSFSFWPLAKLVVFLVVALSLMVWLRRLAASGGYTSGYSFSQAPTNLLSKYSLTMLALGAVSSYFVWARDSARSDGLARFLRALIPASFLWAYVAIMAPWTLGDSYLLATPAAFFAFAIFAALQGTSWLKLRPLILGVAVFAIALSGFRASRGFGRLSDLRKILFSQEFSAAVGSTDRSSPSIRLVVPCLEGSNLVREYILKFTALSVEVVQNRPTDLNENDLLLTDSALCPDPLESQGGTATLIEPSFAGSFGLYKFLR